MNKFVTLIKKAVKLHGKREIADYFHVSLPTVDRWCEGKNLPYKDVREDIANYLESILG